MKEMPIFIGFPAAPVTQIHWRTTGADFLRHHRVRPKGKDWRILLRQCLFPTGARLAHQKRSDAPRLQVLKNIRATATAHCRRGLSRGFALPIFLSSVVPTFC